MTHEILPQVEPKGSLSALIQGVTVGASAYGLSMGESKLRTSRRQPPPRSFKSKVCRDRRLEIGFVLTLSSQVFACRCGWADVRRSRFASSTNRIIGHASLREFSCQTG